MIKSQPIIGVHDVKKSSAWYQKLLGCESGHGGNEFEMLLDEEQEIFLCLHKWNVHDHPTMSNPDIRPGNGLILYLRVKDLDQVWKNAQELKATVEAPPHVSTNSGKQEFSVRDLDGYFLMISL